MLASLSADYHVLWVVTVLVVLGSPVGAQAQRIAVDDTSTPMRRAAYQTQVNDSGTESSPSLIERYQRARLQMLSEHIEQKTRGRVSVAAPKRFRVPSDTLRSSLSKPKSSVDSPAFPISNARAVHKLERGWFEKRFSSTRWSFLGAGRHLTPIDTTMTRVLRAKLQSEFGNPTQVLADFNLRKPRDEYVQFEYWVVVNDSIPVKITDANGARDRGLIVSTSAKYRTQLFALRQALLGSIMRAAPSPYVDYYFETERRRWYRTGYDGSSYFLDRISRYETTPGRRPWLETD
ncbi:hypothetical protein CRI94_09035 [Longibacter salinarum]|uniref:Uncharacterized protein n=1 Tax=Longibacter salinarum TaxID=1850348 RepID=A0A2A8CXX7_9BACT|nr:hypothetical protein [Longibacter salinarum]PEN13454.1 hypothetical protein CRI94_09035 [Longibacter salinarum]